MTICPRHRDLFGPRWQSGRSICTIPEEIAAHKSSSAKGLCGLRSNQSAYVYFKTQKLVPTGSRKSHGTKVLKPSLLIVTIFLNHSSVEKPPLPLMTFPARYMYEFEV